MRYVNVNGALRLEHYLNRFRVRADLIRQGRRDDADHPRLNACLDVLIRWRVRDGTVHGH